MSGKGRAKPKAPAKTGAKKQPPAQPPAKPASKSATKSPAKAPAKVPAKVPAKSTAKAPAKTRAKASGAAKPRRAAAPAATGPTIAFVTTCKGRLHHLKETLPLMAAEQPDELIVVDYSCPDGAGDWVAATYPDAKVVRVEGKKGFNLCDARNHGARAATSDWLFFVDADIRLQPGMLAKLRELLKPGSFMMPAWMRGTPIDIWGSCVCPRTTYEDLDGYDEVFEGWGADDEDFYHRMETRGLERRHYPQEWVSPIVHEDAERSLATGNKYVNETMNACYGMAKREISRMRGGNGNLPIDERRRLMAQARKVVGEWFSSGGRTKGQSLKVRFVLHRARQHGLAAQISVNADTAVTVELSCKPHRINRNLPR